MERLPVTLMKYGLGFEHNTNELINSLQSLNLSLTDVKQYIKQIADILTPPFHSQEFRLFFLLALLRSPALAQEK